MCLLKSKRSWMLAPLIWLLGILSLVLTWAIATPEWIETHFNQHGDSPIEIATVALFFFQIAFLWVVPAMRPSRCRALWTADFSLLTFFAICRELDWHKLIIQGQHVAGSGTPFKMKFIMNANNLLCDRIAVVACFVLVFALFGGSLLFFLRRLWTGLLKMHPVCWSIGFFGGTTILSMIFDRLPAELRHASGTALSESTHALMTALEEGQELLLPVFLILAILQAHFIYNNSQDDRLGLEPFKKL